MWFVLALERRWKGDGTGTMVDVVSRSHAMDSERQAMELAEGLSRDTAYSRVYVAKAAFERGRNIVRKRSWF